MNYIDALNVHNVVKEIEQNNRDIRVFNDAIKSGIVGTQITIKCNDGTFKSTIYENGRIDLLLRVLYEENARLMAKIKDI